MERIRIDKADAGLRVRRREARSAADAQAAAPLRSATPGGGADVDEDLLARIDSLLDGRMADDEDEA